MLAILAVWIGTFVVLAVLWEIFETMILPRAATRPGRLTHIFYRFLGAIRRWLVRPIAVDGLREVLLAAYGPLSLICLVVLWSTLLILAFAAIHWGLHTHFGGHRSVTDFGQYAYFSGTTFFTLGLGDLTPRDSLSRFLTVVEAGMGFAMLAAVIGFLPILYQAFSTREISVARLKNRCGGHIDGIGLIERAMRHQDDAGLIRSLEVLEEWASEIMETTSSYPMLAFYRSQSVDRSWLGALVATLDACTVLQLDTVPPWPVALREQATVTYAMSRDALNVLSRTLHRRPFRTSRIAAELEGIDARLRGIGYRLEGEPNVRRLKELTDYDSVACGLADFLALRLPEWPRGEES